MTISLSGNGATVPDFILGLDGDPALEDKVDLALGSVYTINSRAFVPSQPFDDISDRIKEPTPCMYTVALAAGDSKRWAMHVRTSPARHVTLIFDKRPPVDFVVGGGSVVYDGKAVIDSGRLYVLKLFAVTYAKAPGLDNQEIVRLSTGGYFITAIGLKQHLIETSEVSFPPGKGTNFVCCQNRALATFKIGVSPEGQVVSAVPVKVSTDNSSKLARLASSLRMKPFQSGGKNVAAEAYLTLLQEPSGRVYYFH